VVEHPPSIYLAYQLGQFNAQNIPATLNGTLNISGEAEQRDGVQYDLSSMLSAENLHGFQMGYEHFYTQSYLDVSMSFGYRPVNEWISTPDILNIDELYQIHTQATVGAFKNHNDVFGFIGFHIGSSTTIASIADSLNYSVTLKENDEEPGLQFSTMRTGLKIGARSGLEQGLRVSAEWGIDLQGNTDTQLMLGYFMDL